MLNDLIYDAGNIVSIYQMLHKLKKNNLASLLFTKNAGNRNIDATFKHH